MIKTNLTKSQKLSLSFLLYDLKDQEEKIDREHRRLRRDYKELTEEQKNQRLY